jgi:hypothetical protein
VNYLRSVTVTTLLTDGLFQGHSLYVAVPGDVPVAGTLRSVVSGLEAVMKTPDYQHEVQMQPWGDKNVTKTK